MLWSFYSLISTKSSSLRAAIAFFPFWSLPAASPPISSSKVLALEFEEKPLWPPLGLAFKLINEGLLRALKSFCLFYLGEPMPSESIGTVILFCKVKLKVVPTLSVDLTESPLPSKLQTLLEIQSPIPAPAENLDIFYPKWGCFPLILARIFFNYASDIPMPVSTTLNSM